MSRFNQSISGTTQVASALQQHGSQSLDPRPLPNADTFGVAERAYHELRENPHFEIDGLQRLNENLARLEELQGRMQFMMREIASLTKTRVQF